jgi:hypothetical protein
MPSINLASTDEEPCDLDSYLLLLLLLLISKTLKNTQTYFRNDIE